MQSAEYGLRNLRSTYASDAGTIATLHVISERLEAHCEVIRRFLELPVKTSLPRRPACGWPIAA
jgi:hypothetical protein